MRKNVIAICWNQPFKALLSLCISTCFSLCSSTWRPALLAFRLLLWLTFVLSLCFYCVFYWFFCSFHSFTELCFRVFVQKWRSMNSCTKIQQSRTHVLVSWAHQCPLHMYLCSAGLLWKRAVFFPLRWWYNTETWTSLSGRKQSQNNWWCVLENSQQGCKNMSFTVKLCLYITNLPSKYILKEVQLLFMYLASRKHVVLNIWLKCSLATYFFFFPPKYLILQYNICW